MSNADLLARFVNGYLDSRAQPRKAFASDVERVEAMICALPTRRFQSSAQMSAKELVQAAKRRKLGALSGMERDEIRRLVSDHEQSECAICLEAFTEGAVIKEWNCGHIFHLKCAYAYAIHKAADARRTQPVSCPLCRAPLAKASH